MIPAAATVLPLPNYVCHPPACTITTIRAAYIVYGAIYCRHCAHCFSCQVLSPGSLKSPDKLFLKTYVYLRVPGFFYQNQKLRNPQILSAACGEFDFSARKFSKIKNCVTFKNSELQRS